MSSFLARTFLAATAVHFFGCSAAFHDAGDTSRRVDKLLLGVASRPPTAAEGAVLRDKGLVITGGEVGSFHLGYSALFKAHAPVYFTADGLLDAIHSSYDDILAAVETSALAPALETMISDLRAHLAAGEKGSPEARADLDLYLAVADGLLRGPRAAPVAHSRAAAIVAAANAAAGATNVTLFGEPADLDLSMMKPRGHYVRSELLGRYFKASMWLGRTEIRLARGAGGAWRVNRRALEATILLHALLTGSAAEAHRRIDEATRAFVGPADSMSFAGLTRAARAAGLARVEDLAGLSDAEVAHALEHEATQRIGSQLLGPGDAHIAFLVLAQRYVFDSEVLSAVTYGHLQQKRMMPSPLDVAWGVFHNPAALALLDPELRTFGYRGALDDITRRGDGMGPDLWEGSLYHLWLGALRRLSPDAQRDATLPAVLRTDAWARRLLNTQLASWAELRHDTVLYAKQSITAQAICAYPSAYIEPYPDFFRAVEAFAVRGSKLVAALAFGNKDTLKKRIVDYFARLENVSGTLREMADLERQQQPLRADHLDFMNHAVSMDGKHGGCTLTLEPGGWFADLYFDRTKVLYHSPTIADVHTQPTDEDGNPVGKVLHVATGAPRFFTVTLATCEGPRTYRGVVSSYHEVVTEHLERLDDLQWLERSRKAPDVAWLMDLVAR
jgi:hypothetical protein